MRDFQPQCCQPVTASVVPLVAIPHMGPIRGVKAVVNGRQGLFILDTGADATVFDPGFASERGLIPRPPVGVECVSNVREQMNIVRVESLTLGNTTFEHFCAVIVKLKHFTDLAGVQIDGILGRSVFVAAGRCRLDLKRNQLFLNPAGSLTHPVPMIFSKEKLFMDAQIADSSFRMLVDTAANYTELNSASWDRLASNHAVSTREMRDMDINGVSTNVAFRVLKLKCSAGGLSRKNFPVGASTKNILGINFFDDHVVTFDFKAMQAEVDDEAADKGVGLVGDPLRGSLPVKASVRRGQVSP